MEIREPIDPNAPSPRKGRAALSNDQGRFEALRTSTVADGWHQEAPDAVVRTHVSFEQARRIISYNRSPDLPFDRSINPYRGCEHGCIYCFARPTHAYLGLSPGLDFETRLIARPNAAERLRHELGAPSYQVAPIAIGSNTDAYQPVEQQHEIMRDCLQVLSDCNHPVAIVTKGTGIERDIDLLAPMAAKGLVRVGVSVTTLDRKLSRQMEPRVPAPERRLQIIKRLSAAGIPVRVMVSPVIPALTDHELENILAAGADAGADAASWIMLRLPREVSPLFQEWLARAYPDRAGRIMARLREMHGGQEYSAQWGQRMRGTGPYAELISARFQVATQRLGLDRGKTRLRCDLFRAPERVKANKRAGGTAQLSLF